MTDYQKEKGLMRGQGAGIKNKIQLGTDKGKKVESTIHHMKQPQLSVRVSMIESLNEDA